MQLDMDTVYEGTVTGLTNFGAFVKLDNGTTGMVHISEVAAEYVSNINEHLSEGDQLKRLYHNLKNQNENQNHRIRTLTRAGKVHRVKSRTHLCLLKI